MSKIGDDYKALRESKRADRDAQIERRRNEIREYCRRTGRAVKEMNGGYQFRIDGKIDLYPTNCRWHLLSDNTRGGYGRETIDELIERKLGNAQA